MYATRTKDGQQPTSLFDWCLQEIASNLNPDTAAAHAPYRFKAVQYVQEVLKWSPWAGDGWDRPGQVEILEAYELALQQLHERWSYENDLLALEELTVWQPGQVVKNRIRIEAGHTVGKTKLASGIFNHFFDTCAPSIIYTFAPTGDQINDLLWKEIRIDREGNNLPGRLMGSPELRIGPNYFAKGRATSDAHGRGTERIQGQHNKYLMFILDEAEGIADYVWGAIDSMASGGMVIVIMLANPRTRTSKFYLSRTMSVVRNFRISCLNHPNVRSGKEIVPNAVRREYVSTMVEQHCQEIKQHDDKKYTFEVPWKPGTIYLPNNEFLFRVMGVPPLESLDDTLIPIGRWEQAVERGKEAGASGARLDDSNWATLGVDVARWGSDMGTVYVRRGIDIWHEQSFSQQDTNVYAREIKDSCLRLVADGVEAIEIRVDGGGGFGGGVLDKLVEDQELIQSVPRLVIIEVYFNGTPKAWRSYMDLITEMYAHAAESLKGLRVLRTTDRLETDLCLRKFEWRNRSGYNVKLLEAKDVFKKRYGWSPDDGDGFVLSAAPSFLFDDADQKRTVVYEENVRVSPI